MKNENKIFETSDEYFSVREGKCKVKKVAEEYCWAMTQAAETAKLRPTRLQCFGSLNFKLDSFIYAYIDDHMHT